MEENLTKEQKEHYSKQYERMQDIAVTYASMSIKIIATVTSGALISIGAAFANIIQIKDNDLKNLSILKEGLYNSFYYFSWSLMLTLTNLFVIYLCRLSFLIDCDLYCAENVRNRHRKYGIFLEAIAFLIALASTWLIGHSLIELYKTFKSL